MKRVHGYYNSCGFVAAGIFPAKKGFNALFTKAGHKNIYASKIFPPLIPPYSIKIKDEEYLAKSRTTEQETSKTASLLCDSKLLIPGKAHGTNSISPYLLRSMKKLKRIIYEEMNKIDALEVSLSNLESVQHWKQTGRFHSMGKELFSFQDRKEKDICLNPTHEESICYFVQSSFNLEERLSIASSRLPIRLFQIGRKFRDEKTSRRGLLRNREFEMKDLYTFDSTRENAQTTYEVTCKAYENIFKHLNLCYYKVFASSGTMGGKTSHEYHVLTNTGEDTIHICHQCKTGIQAEFYDPSSACPSDSCEQPLVKVRGSEIAHTFILDDQYTKHFELKVQGGGQKASGICMGCYGIGVSRLLGASLEVLSTAKHLRFPQAIVPYLACIIPQKAGYKADVTFELATSLYQSLVSNERVSDEIVLDDRIEYSIGRRYHIASSLGFRFIIALGRKALLEDPLYEFVDVYAGETDFISRQEVISRILSQMVTSI